MFFPSAVAGEDGADEEGEAAKAKKRVVVCRASYDGMWVSGELRPEQKSCVVSFLGAKKHYERYQVLENVDGGARVVWVSWNKFSVVPTGAVACGDGAGTFVARHRVESNVADDVGDHLTHHIGKLDPKDGLGKISVVNKVSPELALLQRVSEFPHHKCYQQATGSCKEQWNMKSIYRNAFTTFASDCSAVW